jgi:pyrroline-5-carboxylate reductase
MDASTIGFVGGGHMAGALIGGLLQAGHDPESLVVVEPAAAQRERLAAQFGIAARSAADAALARAATVVWAVKPQLFREAAAPCAPYVRGALQVSVMAGIRSAAIEHATGSARIVRAMPNTPALLGRGIAGLHARDAVAAGERAAVEALLAPTGAVLWVQREDDLDAVTAISGSGPAYMFFLVEAMMQAAVEMGLTEAQGRTLALATMDGAAALAQRSPLHPAELRAQVTSRGGTTHAAITSMEADGVKAAVVRALHAARRRAAELGDEFG